MKKIILLLFVGLSLSSCVSENYSNGERIGLITQFSNTGAVWKSYEGELHVTQTGMNSTMKDFDFSIDNDHPDTALINTCMKAAQFGWKVKLTYHETIGKNWFSNRGQTDHFLTKIEVLDKDIATRFENKSTGHIIDTVYVVIDKEELKKQMQQKKK